MERFNFCPHCGKPLPDAGAVHKEKRNKLKMISSGPIKGRNYTEQDGFETLSIPPWEDTNCSKGG